MKFKIASVAVGLRLFPCVLIVTGLGAAKTPVLLAATAGCCIVDCLSRMSRSASNRIVCSLCLASRCWHHPSNRALYWRHCSAVASTVEATGMESSCELPRLVFDESDGLDGNETTRAGSTSPTRWDLDRQSTGITRRTVRQRPTRQETTTRKKTPYRAMAAAARTWVESRPMEGKIDGRGRGEKQRRTGIDGQVRSWQLRISRSE